MKNVNVEVKGSTLTITVDLSKEFGPSSSGKTVIVATTEGNAKVDGPDGPVHLGLNVYKKPEGK
jgi:hypothetical protein